MKRIPKNIVALSVLAGLLTGCTKTNTVIVKPKVTDTTTQTQPTKPTTPTTPVPQNVVINADGTVTSTVLATGLLYPSGLAVDKQGNVFIADGINNCIRERTTDGLLHVIAGQPGADGNRVDGNGSDARFDRPSGLVIDDAGNLFVADANNFCVRKITPAGDVSTFAYVDTPIAIAMDKDGNLYTSRFGYTQINKISPSGSVTPMLSNVMGDGMIGVGINFSPAAVAVDGDGNVYATDYPLNSLRKIAPDGTETKITVNGPVSGPNGNYIDGTIADAHFHGLTGVTVDAAGNIYVCDWGNNAIRVVNTQANTVRTLAGGFGAPEALTIDGSGNIYVAEYNKISEVVHH